MSQVSISVAQKPWSLQPGFMLALDVGLGCCSWPASPCSCACVGPGLKRFAPKNWHSQRFSPENDARKNTRLHCLPAVLFDCAFYWGDCRVCGLSRCKLIQVLNMAGTRRVFGHHRLPLPHSCCLIISYFLCDYLLDATSLTSH